MMHCITCMVIMSNQVNDRQVERIRVYIFKVRAWVHPLYKIFGESSLGIEGSSDVLLMKE